MPSAVATLLVGKNRNRNIQKSSWQKHRLACCVHSSEQLQQCFLSKPFAVNFPWRDNGITAWSPATSKHAQSSSAYGPFLIRRRSGLKLSLNSVMWCWAPYNCNPFLSPAMSRVLVLFPYIDKEGFIRFCTCQFKYMNTSWQIPTEIYTMVRS